MVPDSTTMKSRSSASWVSACERRGALSQQRTYLPTVPGSGGRFVAVCLTHLDSSLQPSIYLIGCPFAQWAVTHLNGKTRLTRIGHLAKRSSLIQSSKWLTGFRAPTNGVAK